MLNTLDNKTLMQHTKELVKRERLLCAKLIAYLAETDHRKLYADEGFPSMFRFLTDGLGYSEPAAHRRLTAARLSRRFPKVLNLLESGAMHLTGLSLLSQQITEENADKLFSLCSHKSKSQIEEVIVMKFNSLPSCQREVVRLVPAARKATVFKTEALPLESIDQEQTPKPPLSQEAEVDVRLSITIAKDSYEKLKRAQVIAGAENLADILKQAIDVFLDQKDLNRKMAKEVGAKKTKKTETVAVLSPEKVSQRTKSIPIAIKRAVFKRDEARCTYMNQETGRRCSETCRLEVDHIHARALGGSNELHNLRLRCRSHNLLAARQVFGAVFMEQKM